jgi:hypothetical protein
MRPTYTDERGKPVSKPASIIDAATGLRVAGPTDEQLARAGIYRAVTEPPAKGMVAVGPAIFDRLERGRAIMVAPTAPAAEVQAQREADEQAARDADPLAIIDRRFDALEARIAALETKPGIIDPTPTQKETRP